MSRWVRACVSVKHVEFSVDHTLTKLGVAAVVSVVKKVKLLEPHYQQY